MAKKTSRAPLPDLPLTPWMGGSTPPTRLGVYLRQAPGGPYACWGGRHWYADAATPGIAASSNRPSRYQALPWRGVATPTPAPCASCRGHSVVDQGYDAELGVDLITECPEC